MTTSRARLGRWGEGVASRFLQEKGYRIITTNYRSLWGELDIIAQDGEELVFVEVRTRHSVKYGTPEESLSDAKVQRLLDTCHNYLQRYADPDAHWRIDLVCIRLGPGYRLESVSHLPYAVQL